MPIFDGCIFDPAIFDASECTEPVTAGRQQWRRIPIEEPEDQNDLALVLLLS